MASLIPIKLGWVHSPRLPILPARRPADERPPLLRIEARAGKKRVPRMNNAKVLNLQARKRQTGTSQRPRLLVFCSDKHLYAQIIDDSKKTTLVSASTAQQSVITVDEEKEGSSASPVLDAAKKLGVELAMECLRQGISKVLYYRRGSLHWRRVRSFQLAAEGSGLVFEYPK